MYTLTSNRFEIDTLCLDMRFLNILIDVVMPFTRHESKFHQFCPCDIYFFLRCFFVSISYDLTWWCFTNNFISYCIHQGVFIYCYIPCDDPIANDKKICHQCCIWIICAGTGNDLNCMLSTFVDPEHKIVSFGNSRYINRSELSILQFNAQSMNGTIDTLSPIMNYLSASVFCYGAIYLQEIWAPF